jgi:hypothetical protein
MILVRFPSLSPRITINVNKEDSICGELVYCPTVLISISTVELRYLTILALFPCIPSVIMEPPLSFERTSILYTLQQFH